MSGEDPQIGIPTTPLKLDTRGNREVEDEMTSQVDKELCEVVGSLMAEAKVFTEGFSACCFSSEIDEAPLQYMGKICGVEASALGNVLTV